MNCRPLTYNQVKWAVHETQSMRQASILSRVSYNTFKKYAKQYGLFSTNQPGRGISKPKNNKKFMRSDSRLFWRDKSEVNNFRDKLLKTIEG